ncbi:MAG TPA: diguanylate cyclase [Syntrophaceae bacterium]|nr:diguanylate cyclase [Syntrophaceae bacterium]
MKVCFPVYKDEGVNSTVYDHFGSSPEFIIVNTELQTVITIDNNDLDHVHGACNPVMAVGGNKIDAVVVGGIGAGALMKLNADGIKVYKAVKETVKENLELLKDNRLPELALRQTCGGHQGCCH